MVRDGEIALDSRQVVVPPVDNFLEVEIEAALRQQYPEAAAGLQTTGTPVAWRIAQQLAVIGLL